MKIRAHAKRALAAEQRRAQEDAARAARTVRRRGGGGGGNSHNNGGRPLVDRTPIPLTKPNQQQGEWGVFSYAPDRPNFAEKSDDGTYSNISHPAFGRGAQRYLAGNEGGRRRPSTPELLERMRRERARATDASRVRAAATIGGTSGSIGGYSGHRSIVGRTNAAGGHADVEEGELRCSTGEEFNEGGEGKVGEILTATKVWTDRFLLSTCCGVS